MTPPRGTSLHNLNTQPASECALDRSDPDVGPQTETNLSSPSQSPPLNAISGRASLERSVLLRVAMFRPKCESANATVMRVSSRRLSY